MAAEPRGLGNGNRTPAESSAKTTIDDLRREIADLEQALENRGVIGQAIGIYMERYSLDADGAWQLLTRLSQERNIKVRDLARGMVSDVTGPDAHLEKQRSLSPQS